MISSFKNGAELTKNCEKCNKTTTCGQQHFIIAVPDILMLRLQKNHDPKDTPRINTEIVLDEVCVLKSNQIMHNKKHRQN